MTPDQLQLFENLGGIGAIFTLVFFAIKWCVVPFIPLMVDYFKGRLSEKTIEKNLMECFEGSHFSDFEKRISKLENVYDEIKDRLLKIEIKLEK